jgi:hypothetical protein
MKQLDGSFMKKTHASLFIVSLLLVSSNAQATTTVTVDDNSNVIVNRPNVVVQPIVTEAAVVLQQTPVVITREAIAGAFEGRIVEVNYSQNHIIIQDVNGTNRQVLVKSEMINSYRVGDYVQIRPTADLTIITIEENPKDFEGEIIRVEMSKSQIVVQDTNGRERRVQLKQGMISTYKVDDYVRIHLMADLKEAKTIETVRNMGRHDGYVVRVDPQGSRMVVRDTHGNERTVLVRQGMITSYRVGNQVRVYQLADHEDVQLVRIIR